MSKRAPKQPRRSRIRWAAAIALAASVVITATGCATIEPEAADTSPLGNKHEVTPNPTPHGFTDESAPDPETVITPSEPGAIAIAGSSVTETTALALLAELPV